MGACIPEKLEWFMNVQRLRHRLSASHQRMLASGTSPNEAINAQINRWMRNLGTVHSQSVQFQLAVCQLGSLLAHNSAAYTPTLAQVRSGDLLAMLVHRLSVPLDAWKALRSSPPHLPLEAGRRRTRGLVLAKGQKRRPRLALRKRTVFTTVRKR